MAGRTREKILDRIRKLLAHARGGATEEEAASAVRRAHALLAEHNLERADVEEERPDPEDRVLDASSVDGSRDIWPARIWHATSALHFCRYFYTDQEDCGRRIGLRHTLIGRRHNVEVAKLTARYLVATVDRLTKEAASAVPATERRSYRTSFQRACGERLAERVYALQREAARTQTVATSRSNLPALLDLYASESERNSAILEAHGIRLGEGKVIRDRLTHAGGAEAGRLAAETISLYRQIGTSTASNDRSQVAGPAPTQLDLFG